MMMRRGPKELKSLANLQVKWVLGRRFVGDWPVCEMWAGADTFGSSNYIVGWKCGGGTIYTSHWPIYKSNECWDCGFRVADQFVRCKREPTLLSTLLLLGARGRTAEGNGNDGALGQAFLNYASRGE